MNNKSSEISLNMECDTIVPHHEPRPGTGPYLDLPVLDRPITTIANEARLWFGRGLAWVYAFNHPEAVVCFQKAVEADGSCAMAYWGIALAHGPNYNKCWGLFDKQELRDSIELSAWAIQKAQSLATTASPSEKALIGALQHRYPESHAVDDNFDSWDADYANAMRLVYERFPDDFDVATLFADSLMNMAPWALWDIRTGMPNPKACTLEAKAVLERGLGQEGGRSHVGLIHMYIHLVEMSPEPELGLSVAEPLRELGADAGHLRHMPSHLDLLIGDYRRAIEANSAAVRANEKIVAFTGRDRDFYTFYRMHDYHTLIYAAMHAGQFQPALETVTKMEACLPEEFLRIESPPMADWMESFMAVRVHVLIRFGRWQDILALEIPRDTKLYCVTTAAMHYGKGVAWAALGNVSGALQERQLFHDSKRQVPPSRLDYPNKSLDLLAVAGAMLDGEIEYRRGQLDSAFARLQDSIKLDDALIYSEPWSWMQPARHAYAALSLEQGRIREAEAAYAADLGLNDTLPRARQHPNNVWALHGYVECLTRLGRVSEARLLHQSLKTALAFADVPISSSCYCRRDSANLTTMPDDSGRTTCC